MPLISLNQCSWEQHHHELSQPSAMSNNTPCFLHLPAQGPSPPETAASTGPLSSLASNHVSENLQRRTGGPQLNEGSPARKSPAHQHQWQNSRQPKRLPCSVVHRLFCPGSLKGERPCPEMPPHICLGSKSDQIPDGKSIPAFKQTDAISGTLRSASLIQKSFPRHKLCHSLGNPLL